MVLENDLIGFLFDSIPGVIAASFWLPRQPTTVEGKQQPRRTTGLSSELPPRLFTQKPPLTLANVLEIGRGRTFGFLLIFSCFNLDLLEPRFLQWLGVNSFWVVPIWHLFWGAIIVVLALQLSFGRKKPWLPRWLTHRPLKGIPLKILKLCISWLERIESISRPRLTSICKSLPGRIVIGVAITVIGSDMAIPWMPTSSIPVMGSLSTIGVFVTGLGLLEDDGVWSLCGLLTFSPA